MAAKKKAATKKAATSRKTSSARSSPGSKRRSTGAPRRGRRASGEYGEGHAAADAASTETEHLYCSLPPVPVRSFPPGIDGARLELIEMLDKKWVNGTVLHYYFFHQSGDGEEVAFTDGSVRFVSWVGADAQREIVRDAFALWEALGIGVRFEEVDTREAAEIRIGFMQGDGSWSFLGRDVLGQASSTRTMNFGWDLARQPDTATHEIGHTLGFPHEHQNPNAGILWDEEAVYAELARTNGWSREKTFRNIIRKIPPDDVQGSSWDADSIMHYPFGPGLIVEPAELRDRGIDPAPGLSARDATWVRRFYPPLGGPQEPPLRPFVSEELHLGPAEQRNFRITPDATRRYEIQTFGTSDVVMVLFEDVNGELRYVSGDDDSGEGRNARLSIKLFAGRSYVLRIRLYWVGDSGRTAVMLW